MIKTIKLWLKQREEENKLVDEIISSMLNEPNEWRIDSYTARKNYLCIWISNSPYADMTINNRRLPRRGELRRALSICSMRRITSLAIN